MRLTKFGHSCLLIEEGQARLLLDPGSYSQMPDDLKELDAILLTHQHADHVSPELLARLLGDNPGAKVYADEDTAKGVAAGYHPTMVHDGDKFEVSGVTVSVHGVQHAPIIPGETPPTNVGYLVAGRFFYPGDALTTPEIDIEILGIPVAAPWSKVTETIDYLRTIKPKKVVPMHEAVAGPMKQSYYAMISGQAKAIESQFVDLPTGEVTEI